ncbi:MAG: Uma2 family endonuclease [Synechococcales bacterium]|nr:Uma2 family endonuclease [Synechococcales bacterium]
MTDTLSTEPFPQPAIIFYPESDGQPMSESDATRDYLVYGVEVLRRHFHSRRNIYVSGNLFIYYQEGEPNKVFSPDVFVILGVSQRKRRTYKTWQEGGKLPSFILEITSFTTRKQDEVEKPKLYASLGVEEYFQYDPTGDYLDPQLKGQRLVDGQYHPMPLIQTAIGLTGIHSQVLGLDLCLEPPYFGLAFHPQAVPIPLELRFYDPQTGEKLLNYQELEGARIQIQADLAEEQQRAEAEAQRAETEKQRADAETQRADAETQRAETEKQRADRLAEKLRSLGIEPETE